MDSLLSDLIGTEHLNLTLLVPVVFVIVGAVLVFVLGLKKPKEPQFKKIASSDSSAAKKPKQRKEKPTPSKSSSTTTTTTSNGNVPAVKESAPVKKVATAPKKEPKPQQQQQVPKKKESTASPKKSAQAAKKPTAAGKPEKVRKPADFDDGEWTKVPSRTDKKKNKDDLTMTQMIDSVLSASKKATAAGDNKKKDGKGTVKNAKQLKDQENKTKKEAAEVNKKNIKNSNSADNNTERIGNILVESKQLMRENIDEIVTVAAAAVEQKAQKLENLIASTTNNDEKTDDNKPVAASGGTVFNELGDAWTEAKAPKKGKKKSRKE